MGRNKTQPKIAAFLSDLTKICNKHGMLVDANGGGGKAGAGKNRDDSRFREGCPLVLYAKADTSDNYRKVGYLWYSFVGEDETLAYNFEPKTGTPYKEVTTPDPQPEEIPEKTQPKKITKKIKPQPKKIKAKPKKATGLEGALKKSKTWESKLEK
jgi:hypothetical protein